MAGEQRTISLGELYDFRSGLSKPRSAFGSGYPFLTFKDVFYNTFVPQKLGDLVKSTERERESCSVKRGDVFLTRTSETMEELGMSCVSLRDVNTATFNGFTKRLRPKPGITIVPEYAGYFFRSWWFRRQVTAMSSLSTRASLNNEMLSRLQMILPDVVSQEAIGCILKSLDDKIELNRHMNQTLEEMARAVFTSWFVDFDPVHAKAEERQPSGLKPGIADLFPSSFEGSELGDIPTGWKVEAIGDVVQVAGGGTPSTKEPLYWEGGVHPFCTPKDMSRLETHSLLQTERHLTDEGLTKISSGQLPAGTVLLSSRAPIGYLAVTEKPVSINQGIIAMVCDGKLPNLYVLYWTDRNMDRVISHANGSTFLEISKRNFRPIMAVTPPKNILHQFMQIVKPLHRRIVCSLRENQQLATTRDALLPKLISGELVVAEAERVAGRLI